MLHQPPVPRHVGIAAFFKALKPNVKIIGVEPTGANAMAQSLAAGQRLTLAKVDAFADGVAVKKARSGAAAVPCSDSWLAKARMA